MPPRLLLLLPPRLPPLPPPLRCARNFSNLLPSSTITPQKFSTTRTLPHSQKSLYSLISDITSYSKFLPYCLSSTVTNHSPTTGSPTEADLRVGWGGFDETFRSRVFCKPFESVQADAGGSVLFEVLRTRWVIVKKDGEEGEGKEEEEERRRKGRERCDVSLCIEYRFLNPIYMGFSQAFVPKVADKMIRAFEVRAEEVLGSGKGR